MVVKKNLINEEEILNNIKKSSNSIELIDNIEYLSSIIKITIVDLIVNDEVDEAMDFLSKLKVIKSNIERIKTDEKELLISIKTFINEYNFILSLMKKMKEKKLMESNIESIINNNNLGIDLISDLYNQEELKLNELVNKYGSEETNNILYELSRSNALTASYEDNPSYMLTPLASNVIHKKYFVLEPKKSEVRK